MMLPHPIHITVFPYPALFIHFKLARPQLLHSMSTSASSSTDTDIVMSDSVPGRYGTIWSCQQSHHYFIPRFRCSPRSRQPMRKARFRNLSILIFGRSHSSNARLHDLAYVHWLYLGYMQLTPYLGPG
jgi:hypothetical protein